MAGDFKNGIYESVSSRSKFLLDDLVNSLDFYDEQVVRMIIDGDLDYENPQISLTVAKKRKLVEENFGAIVEYIIDNSNMETIWGKLSASRIDFLKALANPAVSGALKDVLRAKMIYHISFYLTCKEIETGIFKPQILPSVTRDGIIYKEEMPMEKFIRPRRR